MGIAATNQWRSQQAYQEVRNHWLPQLTVGSGLGYSYGFPLTLEGSAPAVANFTSQQSLFNLSLKQFLKAAKIDWKATTFDIQDKRAEVERHNAEHAGEPLPELVTIYVGQHVRSELPESSE